MKIGILTFHRAQNYGAFMQCYSLSKYLQSIFPNDNIEVIDYNSYNLLHDYNRNLFERIFGSKTELHRPSMIMVLKRIARYVLDFKKQTQKDQERKARKKNFASMYSFLNLSAKSLTSDDAQEFEQFINNSHYDVIIVGSDAIWNDNQTSWPNLYLLHDIKGPVKFSYAASTYGMSYKEKTKEEIAYVKQSLEDFKFIGVRDNATESYVKYVGVDEEKVKPIHTCDPSIFLNLEALPIDMKKLKEKLIKHGVDFNKPIIGLMCESWLAKKVRALFGDSYQYVSVYYYTGCEDVFLADLTPFEWARVFSFFDFTFTHFFHGTLFSIKNGTKTFSIERGSSYKDKYETKIKDVLTRLDLLEECYYEDDKLTREDWKNIVRKAKLSNKIEVKNKYRKKLEIEGRTKDIFIQKLKEAIKCL